MKINPEQAIEHVKGVLIKASTSEHPAARSLTVPNIVERLASEVHITSSPRSVKLALNALEEKDLIVVSRAPRHPNEFRWMSDAERAGRAERERERAAFARLERAIPDAGLYRPHVGSLAMDMDFLARLVSDSPEGFTLRETVRTCLTGATPNVPNETTEETGDEVTIQ